MSETFDIVLKGGVVVNQDGVGSRDVGVRNGRIVALGALTGDAGIAGSAVGKINVLEFAAYVAVERAVADKALGRLINGKIKGRKFKVKRL